MTAVDDPARRWAWAEVDPEAVEHNVGVLRRVIAPAAVWAVVKADGYGHGATRVARAARRAGATGLCVALVEEGEELRAAGLDGPILVLSQPPAAQFGRAVAADLDLTVYGPDAVEPLVEAAHGTGATARVHLKVDTGMQRVGASPDAVPGLVTAVLGARPHLSLVGIATHLAVADEPAHPMNRIQIDRFRAVVESTRAQLRTVGDDPDALLVHAANSAGGLAHPDARATLVRAGIAVYGISPGHGVDDLAAELRPAMRLVARVSHLKTVRAGTAISYGLRHTFDSDTVVATVPLGYADGVPRRLGLTGGVVVVGGRRRPIVGVVTMDQLMVDLGPAGLDVDGRPVAVGDEVVLIGRQGDECVRAEDWADRLDTIGYEIVCGISRRVERVEVPLP